EEMRDRTLVNKPLHPLLFAAYPVLFLFAQNLNEDVSFEDVMWPLVACLAVAGVVYGIAAGLLRSSHKGALVTTTLVLLFFSYGHILDLFSGRTVFSNDGILLPIWGALAVYLIFRIVRSDRDPARLSGNLNLIALVLIALNLVPILLHHPAAIAADTGPLAIPGVEDVPDEAKRDIYYLIFDRYPNPQTFENLYHFDNSDLFDFLEEKGFYIARDTLANHLKTQHSLASSLNLRYLNYLHDDAAGADDDQTPVQQLLQNYKLERYLKSLGYRSIHLGSWFPPTLEDYAADDNFRFNSWSQFSSRLLETTMWRGVRRELGIRDPFDFWVIQRKHALYQFEKLKEIKELPGPKFVFAHFLLPHPPYVFDRNGGFIDHEPVDMDKPRMFEQLRYTNKRMKEMVSDLLAGPDETDPIIVIQSDEGPHPPRYQATEDFFDWTTATRAELGEKLRILNTYYLPGVDQDRLYPSISPVNSFRLIFDLYFGADMPLLKDRSFVFHDWHHLYDFTDVTDRLRPERSRAGESGANE
ncbi:MAG: hypothetical protein QOH26_1635, partial [Actinomycetota bacterium]|nr:hypothetical protein [Actinomycetota bacterium]